ncbi:MAG: hypothetical protein PHU98_02210 [Mariniphaga sp.]|nr:hypothetical protein [Mariniphaga sp.]
MMRNKLIVSLLVLLIWAGNRGVAYAQLKGISYSFTPLFDYSYTAKNSGFANSPSLGGQFGFGFGEYIGLSAVYLKSINGNTNFGNLTGTQLLLSDKQASLERLGGEFQVNLSQRRLIPYLTLGTGVQTISTENTEKNKQIYLSSGAGLSFHLFDRMNLGLQAVHTTYRLNAYHALLTPEEWTASRVDLSENSSRYISDWSARVKLSIILGGMRTGKMNEIDQALLDQFSGGLKGFSLQVEPTLMYVNFKQNLPYNDAFYTGFSTGFDFGPFIGIRGFYLHAMDESSFLSFNKSSIWGGETKFKLNVAQGMVPFLTLGGGRINALNGYIPENGLEPENKVFASGGLGLELPLSKRIKIIGFAQGLLTSMQEEKELTEPENIITNVAYGVKIGFSLGKKPESVENLITKKMNDLKIDYDSRKNNEIDQMVQEYQILLNEKNEELKNKNAVIDSLQISAQNNQADIHTSEVSVSQPEKSGSIIQVTPDEFVSIIRAFRGQSAAFNQQVEAVDSIKYGKNNMDIYRNDTLTLYEEPEEISTIPPYTIKDTLDIRDSVVVYPHQQTTWIDYDSLNQSVLSLQLAIDSIHAKIDESNTVADHQRNEFSSLLSGIQTRLIQIEQQMVRFSENSDQVKVAATNYSNLTKELKGTNKNIDDIAKQLRKLENEMKKSRNQPILVGINQEISEKSASENTKKEPNTFNYSHMSVLGGLAFGEDASFNLGLRTKYIISDSFFSLVPETFIGLGSPVHLGFFVNAVYDINLKNSETVPYFGIGTGVLTPNEESFTGVFNIMLGASVPKITKGLYFDFTTRNFFKYNQISVGYYLPF